MMIAGNINEPVFVGPELLAINNKGNEQIKITPGSDRILVMQAKKLAPVAGIDTRTIGEFAQGTCHARLCETLGRYSDEIRTCMRDPQTRSDLLLNYEAKNTQPGEPLCCFGKGEAILIRSVPHRHSDTVLFDITSFVPDLAIFRYGVLYAICNRIKENVRDIARVEGLAEMLALLEKKRKHSSDILHMLNRHAFLRGAIHREDRGNCPSYQRTEPVEPIETQRNGRIATL